MRIARHREKGMPVQTRGTSFFNKNKDQDFFAKTPTGETSLLNTSFLPPKYNRQASGNISADNKLNETNENKDENGKDEFSVIQRKCKSCDQCKSCGEEEDGNESGMVMKKSESATGNKEQFSTKVLDHSLQNSKNSGNALPPTNRREMEHAFGTDFKEVKIHTDTTADQMNKDLNAEAFTHGEHIYFSQGAFNTHTTNGKRLLSHELTHVVQQRQGTGSVNVQRTIGDGHDLQSPRFSGNLKLEAAFDNQGYISIGANGTHVSILQQALIDAGHPLPKFGVDGIFGSETNNAVRSYQKTRNLIVDGIVGPETMGDLDLFFKGTTPNTHVPPNICSLLESDEDVFSDENGLILVSSLNQNQQQLVEDASTINLPNGDEGIKCQTPAKTDDCKKLCGCPLPSSGYKGKVGDLALTMEKATAFHQNNPTAGKDPRKLVCPPKGTPVRVLAIVPAGNITFLKVRFCNGSIPDKQGNMVSEVFIQQQFVADGKQLSIKGPDEVVKSNKVTLKAEGAHQGTQPDWDVLHDSNKHGRVKIDGSDKNPEVKIEGKELSSLEGDVTIKVSVCGNIALHRLTVVQPFKPNLPIPKTPKTPIGPKKSPKAPESFCTPYNNKTEAENDRLDARSKLKTFINLNHGGDKDVMDLYMTYINKPKTGTTGKLFPRKFFSNPKSNFVKSFMTDNETVKEKKRIKDLIIKRVSKNPKLIPPVGKTTLIMPFRTVLKSSEITDLPMRFKNPSTRIPGFVAGGPGKDSSDAGDDVRNADGQFRVTNLGGGLLRFQIKYTFDVFDAVDFCPGATGGFFAKLLLTETLSQLEATPDVPTYDTPFEVLYNLTDDFTV